MRLCIECQIVEIGSHTRRQVCSQTCQNRRRERQRQRNGAHWTVCPVCDLPVREVSSSAEAPTHRECRKVVATTPIKRAYIRKAVRMAVYMSDDWTCWLCREPVDPHLMGTRSMYGPSLDHVIPHSRGGDDSPDNLRLAHWFCNAVRSDKPVEVTT